jgi:hypothetical protein
VFSVRNFFDCPDVIPHLHAVVVETAADVHILCDWNLYHITVVLISYVMNCFINIILFCNYIYMCRNILDTYVKTIFWKS